MGQWQSESLVQELSLKTSEAKLNRSASESKSSSLCGPGRGMRCRSTSCGQIGGEHSWTKSVSKESFNQKDVNYHLVCTTEADLVRNVVVIAMAIEQHPC